MTNKAPHLAVSINIVLSTRGKGYQMRHGVGSTAQICLTTIFSRLLSLSLVQPNSMTDEVAGEAGVLVAFGMRGRNAVRG
jgi:hypothetical protein